jgi:hypothetical protein
MAAAGFLPQLGQTAQQLPEFQLLQGAAVAHQGGQPAIDQLAPQPGAAGREQIGGRRTRAL